MNAANTYYINFTGASWVKTSHAYFGEPSGKNANVREFFQKAFTGQAAEDGLRFHPDGNYFQI